MPIDEALSNSSVTASGFFGNGAGLTGTVTQEGNTFNGANQLVKLDGSGSVSIGGSFSALNSSVTASGLFGNGAGIVGLSAANITAGGTLPALDGSALTNLPASGVLVNSSPTWSGSHSFLNRVDAKTVAVGGTGAPNTGYSMRVEAGLEIYGNMNGADIALLDSVGGLTGELFIDNTTKDLFIIAAQGGSMSLLSGGFQRLIIDPAGSVSINRGTNVVYKCVGSTAGVDDDLLAVSNTNANHCIGGTWTATSLRLD